MIISNPSIVQWTFEKSIEIARKNDSSCSFLFSFLYKAGVVIWTPPTEKLWIYPWEPLISGDVFNETVTNQFLEGNTTPLKTTALEAIHYYDAWQTESKR